MALNSTELNKKYMLAALNQAKIAYQLNEIPVGAAIVKRKKIISLAFNKKEKLKNPLAHAEIIAINLACKKLQNWRLLNCEIFITLQPCLMCTEAIAQARIKKIHYATTITDLKNKFQTEIFQEVCFKNKIQFEQGLYAKESNQLLLKFFNKIRSRHHNHASDR